VIECPTLGRAAFERFDDLGGIGARLLRQDQPACPSTLVR
jgi:hypothetical protein